MPVCLVAKELRSGRLLRVWHDDFGSRPPYPTDSGVLFVAYYAAAEVSCHLALDWPVPEWILDLFAEFRVRTNGAKVQGRSLLHALDFHGLAAITKAEKDAGRDLAMQGHWTAQERRDLLDYCQTPTWTPWPRSCPTCGPRSATDATARPVPSCAAGTWPRWRAWRLRACRSTP